MNNQNTLEATGVNTDATVGEELDFTNERKFEASSTSISIECDYAD